MTGAEFRSKYNLRKQVTHQGAVTHHALDSSGQVVMVHFLGDPASPECRRLLALVDRLSVADRRRIIEQIEVDDALVIVTQFFMGFESLERWLERRVPAQPPPPPTAPRAPSPGEFTQLFGRVQASQAAPPSPEPGPTPPAEAGEFTRLFRAQSAQPAAPAQPPAPPAQPAAQQPNPVGGPDPNKPIVRWREAKPSGGGEEDKPAIHWKKDVSPPPARSVEPPAPGELTRLFGAGEAARPAAPAPTAPPRRESNDYLQALRESEPAEALPPGHASPSPSSEPGEFTRLMSGLGSAPPSPLAAPAPGSRGAAAPASGPSEFTRIVAGIPASRPPAPPIAPPAYASPAAGTKRDADAGPPRPVVLFVLVGVGAVTVLALILYFTLR
jgi:hypothetical protein